MGASMRQLIEFACAGDRLVGTLDDAAGRTGLLIVSGGNEIRCGAHRGMAELAAALAAEGIPVFRYDRRGIGDSSGTNGGWESSAPDIAAAAATFAATKLVPRIVAFGNCDAATALARYHQGAGIEALVLANPWTGGSEDALPPAAAIRARYAAKLRDPREWLRLARGGVDLGRLAKGLRKAGAAASGEPSLAQAIATGLGSTATTILLANGDNTAIAFRDAWQRLPTRPEIAIASLASASHSFATVADKQWLKNQLLSALTAG